MPHLSVARLASVLSLLLIATPAAAAEPVFVDGIVAVVGSDIITWSEIEETAQILRADPTFVVEPGQSTRRQVLERLIEDGLISQAAAREGIQLTDDDVDRAINSWMAQNQITREILDRELSREGISWDEYHSNMRKHLLQSQFIDQVITPRVTVSDAQIRAYYAREISNVQSEQAAQVWVIFLPFPDGATDEQRAEVVATARGIKAGIKAGEISFEDAARAQSDHPSASDGGLLGTFRRGELFPALNDAAFKSKTPGEIGEPLVTPQGVFLARSEITEISDTLSLEEARPQIEGLLFQQELERQVGLWVQDARRQAHVEILIPDERFQDR